MSASELGDVARPSRRAVAKGVAWATPLVVVGAAAPAYAASCFSAPLQLLYGDYGTVTSPIVSYTGSSTSSCQTFGGASWTMTTYTLTIKNNSTMTIANLQVPMPYEALSNSGTGCVTPGTQTSSTTWSNSTLTGYSGGLTAGRDTRLTQGTTGTLTTVPFSTFTGLIPATISGTGANGGKTLCSAATAPATTAVYYPPVRTLAAGASTTFTIVTWVESTSGCGSAFNAYFPDFIVGSPC